MNDNKNAITALVFTCLMIISPLAGAANITNFGGGTSEVTVDVRDAPDFTNSVDGVVVLPSGDTVTSASMKVSTAMATHEDFSSINSDTALYVWDPAVNNQQTEYSTLNDFTYHEDTVKLVSGGFSTDFERTDASFFDHSAPLVYEGTMWEHGTLSDSIILNDNCNTGNECWGTNMYDWDNDYTNDDQGSAFSYSLISPEVEVDPSSHIARFSSWHGLYWSQSNPGTNPTNTYYDCGYVMVRSSSSPNGFQTPDTGWSYIPFDMTNSSGVNYANGLYPIGAGNGKIQNCDGLTGTDYALGGESTHPTQNPNGWATLAVNLADHIHKYVQLKFVMSHNSGTGAPQNTTMPGWFIDDFRIGDPLPQTGTMTVKGFTPIQAPNPGFPDGYGVLNLEQETTPTNSLTVSVVRGSTTEIVIDSNGNQMTGLEGPIIELWDIDSAEYPVIDLVLEFDTGQYRLSTAELFGINIGTRVGTGLNDSSVAFSPLIEDGVWQTPGGGVPLFYTPTIVDNSFNPPHYSQKFSQPIVSITPTVLDDCAEIPAIELNLRDNTMINLTVGQKWTPDDPIFGFTSMISYNGMCGLSELWFDLEFGHNAESVSLDIAEDGDIEWAMNEPAFGSFGRQNSLWAGFVDGVNQATDSSTLTLNTNGEATGGSFMLPMGSDVVLAEVIFSDNTAADFDLSLTASGQEVDLGTMPNQSLIAYETIYPMFALKDALNSLLTNPLLQPSYIDDYGNQWATFNFEVVNINASSGTQVTVSNLDVIYDWETTLDSGNNFDRELNQGIALGTGANIDVPLSLSAGSGGAVKFSDLSITTSTGYDSSLTLTGSPEGLYPNGDIVEAVSIHSVDSSTGTSFAESRLRMESSSGVVELAFSELSLFSELSDPDNLVTMESSTYTTVGNEMHVTWRFRINTAWEDTAELRLYASLVATNGVKGLPGAVVLAPVNGNAIENDAMISSFELLNDAGIVQNLESASSNQNIHLVGSVRLEGLDVSPDPTSYNLSLQRWDVQTINGTVVSEWIEVSNSTGVIGGDFDWGVNLGLTAAGQATYRFMMNGYEGGDTLCPPAPIVSDADCAIPFNLSIDTYSPSLVNISVLKSSNYDPTIWSNWRGLVDDTWVLPNAQQKVRVLAQDIPEPPSTLDMYYWVEYDHDSDGDGVADPDEYVLLMLNSDGNAPVANYTGIFSDNANKGQDPPGKVSIYIEGTDLGGNAVVGGGHGFEDDLVTYVSMDAKTPNIRNFFIEDSEGHRLHNPNEGAPLYQGPWNMSMYAGNQYHLIVEATDENGWRDINYFEIDLGPENMVVYYSPRNETAWSNSVDIEIIEASNESDGPQVLRMDGGRLIDPFEDEFYLDLPIRMNWDIIGIESTTYVPQLRIKDMDRDPSLMSESGGRHKQRWVYSDGIQLDYRNGISPSFTDMSAPYSNNLETSFVFPVDTILVQGQYAYVDGINNGVYILPEGEFTLEITRLAAVTDSSKGYYPYSAGGADGSKTDGPTLHTMDGGAFSINITAPPLTNEYTYTFRLVNLPDGATDTTASLCDGNNAFGCGSFTIKVDGSAPVIDDDSWSAKSGINQDVLASTLPSSTMHCVDVEAVIEENAALITGEVNLRWSFYTDAASNLTWPVYGQRFGVDAQIQPMDLKIIGSDYLVSADCVDLWPDPQDPSQEQISQIDVIMWIEGRDSAGWPIDAGGPNNAEGISSIYSSNPVHNSEYRLLYEEAKFSVIDVTLYPKDPQVGDTPVLDISIENIGTMDGSITLEILSVKEEGYPVTETTYTTDEIEKGEMAKITIDDLESFGSSTSGMYYVIKNKDTNEVLWQGNWTNVSGGTFNVAEASEDEGFLSGLGMLIVVGLGALILILLVAVVVLAKRNSGDGTYEYEYEYEEDDKSYAEIPAVQANPVTGPPDANVDPLMAAAMAEFPQWDQATIQGYFDQGWDINSLRDWVNEQ